MGDIRSFMIALVISIVVVVGLCAFYSPLATSYNVDGVSNFTSAQSAQDIMLVANESAGNVINQVQGEIQGETNPYLDPLSSSIAFGKAVINSLKLMFMSLGLLTNFIFDMLKVFTDIGLPFWLITGAAMTIITIHYSMEIVSAFLKYRL
jgi:hypothetical protein